MKENINHTGPEIKIKPKLSQFAAGDIFVGTISSFESSKVFHVVKDGYLDSIKTVAEPVHMWWIPAVNETFYVLSDGQYIRCARLPVAENVDSSSFMHLYLQDTGESFIIAIGDLDYDTKFVIPEALSKIPGLAVRCIWKEIDLDLESETEESFLQNNVYKKFTFEVVEVSKGILSVIILPYDDNSFDSVEYEDIVQEFSSSSKSILEGPAEGEGVDLELMQPAEGPSKTLQNQNIHENDKPTGISKEAMSAEQLEAWKEEPLNTGDPQIAVDGFKTRDDENRCRFYDAAIGGCFKGGRCKQIHLSEIADGTCRDRREVVNGIAKSMVVPAVGTKVKVQVTQVKSFRTLACRLSLVCFLEQQPSENDLDVQDLLDHMNMTDGVEKYNALTEQPALKELVIAKVENTFLRGRIEDWTDSESAFEVLMLDFGFLKKVDLNDLFRWSSRFDYFPFQTLEIVIANIQPIANDELAAENKLNDLIEDSGNQLYAEVVDNFCDVECVLFNKNQEDVGKKLVNEGFVDGKALNAPTIYKRSTSYPG